MDEFRTPGGLRSSRRGMVPLQYTAAQLFEMARQQAQLNPKIASVLYAKAQAKAQEERMHPEYVNEGRPVVVAANGLYLRSAPSEGSAPIAALAQGTALAAFENYPPTPGSPSGWIRVMTQRGQVGYVSRGYVMLAGSAPASLPAMTFSER